MLSVVHKTFLVLLMLSSSIYMHASDTLKVKKVRFFIEPKAVFYIPIQKTATTLYQGYLDSEVPGNYSGKFTETYKVKNNTTLNFGFAAGMSVRLNKYLYYELALTYYHFYQSAKSSETSRDSLGNTMYNITYNQKSIRDVVGISNGLSLRIKKFIFTNSISLGFIVFKQDQTLVTSQGNTWQQPTCGCVNDFENRIFPMLESKIGYSFLNGRIEPFVGVNFSPLSPLDAEYTTFPLMLFSSVKVNF